MIAQGDAPPVEPAAEDTTVLGRSLHEWIENLLGDASHPGIQAGTIMLLGVVLAKVLDFTVCRILKNFAKRSGSLLDDRIIDMAHGPIVKSTIVLSIALAAHPLELREPYGSWTERVLVTIAILVWTPFVFRATSLLLRSASAAPGRFTTIEPRTYPLFDNLAKVLLFGGFLYAVIEIWDVNPAGFVASAGLLGIAIGFAAQDTLSNLFAGVFIIADAPYRVGDFITLDTGERGRVTHIGLRSTRLLTRDDIEITIPNATMGQAKITNEAGGPTPKHRIRVRVSVAYGSDVDRVRELLVAVAEEDEDVSKDPEPRVRFRTFGESGLDFELLCWIPEPVLRGRVLDALNTEVYKRFGAEGIEIPYPKRDVFVHTVPPGTEIETEAPGTSP